jgi:hypothetical protein
MRGAPAPVGVAVSLTVAACALPSTAGAEKDVFGAYGELFGAVRPAPLVATVFPTAMGPVGGLRIATAVGAQGRYTVLYKHVVRAANGSQKLAADLLVRSLGTRSLSAEARSARRLYREQSTVVRGRHALLLRTRHGPSAVALIWSEARRIYVVGTFTPRALSPADLQVVAGGLDHVLGVLRGQGPVGANAIGATANALVTERAVILSLAWGAPCTETGSTLPPPEGESGATMMMRLNAGGFSLVPTPFPRDGPERSEGEPSAFTVSLSGTASPTEGAFTFQATGEGSKLRCSTGAASVHLSTNPQP